MGCKADGMEQGGVSALLYSRFVYGGDVDLKGGCSLFSLCLTFFASYICLEVGIN